MAILKRQKPDDYFSNGKIELSRYGKLVSLRNHLSSDDIKKKNEYLISKYDEAKAEIDELVTKIREEIAVCNPLMLLMCATDVSMSQLIHVVSESELNQDETDGLRFVEYIQSILVSQEPGSTINDEEEQTKIMFAILADIEELYNKCRIFYILWAAKEQEAGEYSQEEIGYIIETQLMSNVRGNRYQYFQLKDMRELLTPHDRIIQEIYGVTSEQLMDGLQKLEYSLLSAKLDAFKIFTQSFEDFCKETEGLSGDDVSANMEKRQSDEALQKSASNCFGTELYDVKKVTGWTDELINSLSYNLGEDSSFVSKGDYPG